MAKKAGTVKKKSLSKADLDQTLIDNFINLQKVLTNLSLRFEELSGNISKLLQLFEISAKNFAEKYSDGSNGGTDKDFVTKLDSLLDQNKTISKGIMLMEERIREKEALNPNSKDSNFQQIGRTHEFAERSRSRPLPRY